MHVLYSQHISVWRSHRSMLSDLLCRVSTVWDSTTRDTSQAHVCASATHFFQQKWSLVLCGGTRGFFLELLETALCGNPEDPALTHSKPQYSDPFRGGPLTDLNRSPLVMCSPNERESNRVWERRCGVSPSSSLACGSPCLSLTAGKQHPLGSLPPSLPQLF